MNFCNYCYTRTDACSDCHAAELAAKDKEIEKLRIQLAACGVAALSNTRKSREEQGIDKDNPFYSASYADVCDAVNREIEHREEIEGLKAQIAAMRRCEICQHDNEETLDDEYIDPCQFCLDNPALPNWELSR